jgi:hypothetical protein
MAWVRAWRRVLLAVVVARAADGAVLAVSSVGARADDSRCDGGLLNISLLGSCPSSPPGGGVLVDVHVGVNVPPVVNVDVTLCLDDGARRHDDDCRKPTPTPTPQPTPTPAPVPSPPAPPPPTPVPAPPAQLPPAVAVAATRPVAAPAPAAPAVAQPPPAPPAPPAAANPPPPITRRIPLASNPNRATPLLIASPLVLLLVIAVVAAAAVGGATQIAGRGGRRTR